MSINDPDPLRGELPFDSAEDSTRNLDTAPRYLSNSPQPLSASSQGNQYLSNSPPETRHSTSPLGTRYPTHDQPLSVSPTAAELYIHSEPFPELPSYPVHVTDPLIHIQQPSNEQDEPSQMPDSSQPSSFAPFFTLITDSTAVASDDKDGNSHTPTTHHPSKIHYIFSDDEDSDLLKDACLRCIPDIPNLSNSNSSRNQNPEDLRASNSSSRSESARQRSSKNWEEKQREERIIIIDMNQTGDRVLRAKSLSDKWQLMGCEVGKAPIYKGAGEEKGEKEKSGALMLMIDGVGVPISKEEMGLSESREKEKGKGKGKGKGIHGLGLEDKFGESDMDKLLEGFDKKMSILRKVIGGGEWDEGQDGYGEMNMDGEADDVGMMIPEENVDDFQKKREREGEAFEAS